MKTAMHNHIDDLAKLKDISIDSVSDNNLKSAIELVFNGVIKLANSRIEEEKENISNAHDDALKDRDSYGGVTYYNDTFKQD